MCEEKMSYEQLMNNMEDHFFNPEQIQQDNFIYSGYNQILGLLSAEDRALLSQAIFSVKTAKYINTKLEYPIYDIETVETIKKETT